MKCVDRGERAALEASKSMHYKAFTDNDEDLKPSKQLSLTKAEKQHMDPEALSKQRQLLMFRATLGDSFGNASGLNSAEEQDELMSNVVAHECSKMHFPFTQLEQCQQIYKTHLDLLSKIFRFFCGVSSAGGRTSMTYKASHNSPSEVERGTCTCRLLRSL